MNPVDYVFAVCFMLGIKASYEGNSRFQPMVFLLIFWYIHFYLYANEYDPDIRLFLRQFREFFESLFMFYGAFGYLGQFGNVPFWLFFI